MHESCLCARFVRIAGYLLLMLVVGTVGGTALQDIGEALTPALNTLSVAMAEPAVPAPQTPVWRPQDAPDPVRNLDHHFEWIQVDAARTFWPWSQEYRDRSGGYSRDWLAPYDIQIEVRERIRRLESSERLL